MNKRPSLRDALLLLVAVGFVLTSGHEAFQRRASAAAREITRLGALDLEPGVEVTNVSRVGRHLGFDTYAYPGDVAMLAWRHQDVPYEWVGYYLPAPCHKGTTWSGKRERLVNMGWGIAVIYVGQQAWDQIDAPAPKPKPKPKPEAKRTTKLASNDKATTRKAAAPRGSAPVKKVAAPAAVGPSTCSRSLLGAARGRMEADDAIAKTAAEGFPRGSTIFLDIEWMRRTPQAMRDYARAWTERMLEDGRYRPGYYVHTRNAEVIYRDMKAVHVAAGRKGEPPFWIASGAGFHQNRMPHESGHEFAGVWQGVLDVVQEWNGVKLPIDVNVAAVPSPSSHEYAAAE